MASSVRIFILELFSAALRGFEVRYGGMQMTPKLANTFQPLRCLSSFLTAFLHVFPPPLAAFDKNQQLCEQYCRSMHADVYGLQYGHECWCGDHMNYDLLGPGECDYRCVGDKHTTCGGCKKACLRFLVLCCCGCPFYVRAFLLDG